VATQRISNAVEGTIALIHPHGRAEIGVNRERLHHNLIGHALNPNLQSVLLVGYEAKTTERYTQELRARQKNGLSL